MYWKHFLALERDLEIVSRYIELDSRNYPVFSVELVKLLLAVGSETDVVLKALCRILDPNKNPENINEYREIVLQKYPQLPNLRVKLLETSIVLEPWLNWASGTNPDWWRTYNEVKHDRTNKYSSGNLGQVLNASAGLMVAILYQMHAAEGSNQDHATVINEARLFDTENKGAWDPAMITTSYALLV